MSDLILHDVIFFSSAIQHPRHQKRIRSLKKVASVYLMYTTRDQYSGNMSGLQHPADSSCFLGHAENGRYLFRLKLVLRLYRKLRKRREQVVYCTSSDAAIVAILARKKVVLEIGDIQTAKMPQAVARILENYLLKRIALLVVTSPLFICDYFAQFRHYKPEKAIVVENKLPLALDKVVNRFRCKQNLSALNNTDGKLRLGLIGMIRFKEQLQEIAELLRARQDLELHIHGDGVTDIFDNVPRCTNHGEFRNPRDLESIYSGIDINVILYDSSNAAVVPALPNKLYESIAFVKPIICSSDCGLQRVVEQYNIGVAAKPGDLGAAIDQVASQYELLSNNIIQLPKSSYLDDDTLLLSRMRGLELLPAFS